MFAIDKKRLWLLGTGGSALVAGVGTWLFLHHLEASYQDAGEWVSVWVASRYVPRGTALRPAFFRPARVPKAYVEPGALRDFEVLESSPGRPRFRNALSLPPGTQLVQQHLLPIAQGDTLAQIIPDNQAAVSFSVDAMRGLGGNLQPGDLIDILHTSKARELDTTPRSTGVLFQAVPVIAVGKKWASPGRSEPETSKELDEKLLNEEESTVLTVLLNPLAAVRLAQARENDILSVVLRAVGDERIMDNVP